MNDRLAYLMAQVRLRLATDKARRNIAGEVDAIVRRHVAGKDAIDPFILMRIGRELDALFGTWYGRFRGDTSAQWHLLINEHIGMALTEPITRTAAEVRRRLPKAMVQAIEREAA